MKEISQIVLQMTSVEDVQKFVQQAIRTKINEH
jgi:hypothetical protein